MRTLMWTVVSAVALTIVLPISGSGQGRTVVVTGNLQVYNMQGPICSEIRGKAVIYFDPHSENLSFDGQTKRFDRYCQWIGTGILFHGKASLSVNAKLTGFVQRRPNEPINVRSTDSGSQPIRKSGINVILYDKERFSSETRALANQLVRKSEITQAIELYDEAFENLPDPETLFLKADALDRAGRYADAASTWHQALEIMSDDEALAWRRASVVPWRWTNSLYKAAEAGTDPSPETWLNVAEAAEKALDLQLPSLTNRPQIMAVWIDSLFNAANVSGDYSRLSEAIRSDQDMQNNWNALFYKGFRNEPRPDSPSRDEILRGIAELQAALGRPVQNGLNGNGALQDR